MSDSPPPAEGNSTNGQPPAETPGPRADPDPASPPATVSGPAPATADRADPASTPAGSSSGPGCSWADAAKSFRWPIALIVICTLGTLIAYNVIFTARDAANILPHSLNAVAKLAQGFRSENINTTFTAALPELVTPKGGNLEVAVYKTTETFSRANDKRILWDYVSLGTTVTEIRAPVTYRYHVRLADPWELEVRGHVCVVRAPAVRASLPPAIHTDGMEKKTDRGWLRLNGKEQMRDLEKSITPTLSTYAERDAILKHVRETSRKTVADFIRAWLLREEHWRSDRFSAVIVVFEGEEASDAELLPPTVTLEGSE